MYNEITQVTIANDRTLYFLHGQAYFDAEKSAAVDAFHFRPERHSTAC